MRKLAPVFFSSILVLGSASALAMGDMNKNKKSATADTAPQTSSSTYSTPSTSMDTSGAPSSGSGTATDKPGPVNDSDTSSRKGSDSFSGSPSASTGGTASMGSSGTNGAAATTASTDKSRTKAKKKQVARNDMRCDQSANPGHPALPQDCLSKSDTGAAAVNSTQGQSGGASQ